MSAERSARSVSHAEGVDPVRALQRVLSSGPHTLTENDVQVIIKPVRQQRLAILASDKHGRSGRNWASHYNGTWFRRLGVYTLTGTVRYGFAHASR